MSEPIDERYFNWLCAKVLSVDVPIYWDLMRIMYKTEFVWVIEGDKNRAEDGVELRQDFLRQAFIKNDPHWFNSPCSVLEVLIAFANRAWFQTDIPSKEWFWTFMVNLGLDEFRQVSASDERVIDDILYAFIWRTYDDNGHGGMFPMRWPQRDQREVEIWYQFCEYLDHQGIL